MVEKTGDRLGKYDGDYLAWNAVLMRFSIPEMTYLKILFVHIDLVRAISNEVISPHFWNAIAGN